MNCYKQVGEKIISGKVVGQRNVYKDSSVSISGRRVEDTEFLLQWEEGNKFEIVNKKQLSEYFTSQVLEQNARLAN